jgi:hypothetical protein
MQVMRLSSDINKYPLKRPPETKDDIVTSMCYTWDHAFGLDKDPEIEGIQFTGGYTPEERRALWNQMSQLYDHHVAPYRK